MTVNPFAVGAGAAVATGLAVGFGASKITDGIAEKHPNGSDADKPAGRVTWGAAGLSFAAAAGGMAALATGRLTLGAGLFGAGFGGMIGAIGSGIAFQARHGVGVETTLQGVLDGYDHNRSGDLELEDRGWFREPETIRTHTYTREDSDGDTYWVSDTYSIERLATRADRNEDWVATAEELRSTIASYDADGNGRLQGDEYKRFDREVGERKVGWGW